MKKEYHTYESLVLGQTEIVARRRGDRGAMPRFTVIADGMTFQRKTVYQLDRLLGSIYAKQPIVFVNAGFGITLNFDY